VNLNNYPRLDRRQAPREAQSVRFGKSILPCLPTLDLLRMPVPMMSRFSILRLSRRVWIRSQVFAQSRLVICVPASHMRMHSALASATAALPVRAAGLTATGSGLAGVVALGAGGPDVMEPVWARAAPAPNTSATDVTMTRMRFPRDKPLPHDQGPGALNRDRDLCVAQPPN